MAFADGGYYVMRDGWTPAANYLLLDCGPHGVDNCGHAHADALAFELAVHGQTLLVDPGTFTYTGSKELRDWFRSSAAHNTLTVDGESSSVSAGPFSWNSIAQSHAQAWISRARFDYFEGTHDGYQRLRSPVMHVRGVLFLKNDYWVIRDRVQSDGEHRYDLWFHPNFEATQVADGAGGSSKDLEVSGGATRLKISSFAGNSAWKRDDAWVSQCYGERAAAPGFVFSATASAGTDFVTFLVPQTLSERLLVHEIEAIGGRAFEVVGESAHDIVMIKTGNRVETARLASDFDWTWARFSGEDESVPQELVL